MSGFGGSYSQNDSNSSSTSGGPLSSSSGTLRGQTQHLLRDSLFGSAPQFENLFRSTNATLPNAVSLPIDQTGLLPQQREAFSEAVKQAISGVSGKAALSGMLRPENVNAVAGSAVQNVLPQFAPMIGQNVRDAVVMPFQTAMQRAQYGTNTYNDFFNRVIAALGGQSASSSGGSGFGVSASYGTAAKQTQDTVGTGGGAVCWIAGVLYGEGSPEQAAIRSWLLAQEHVSGFWAWFVAGYRRYGQRIARAMRQSPRLTRMVRPVFTYILRRAYGGR